MVQGNLAGASVKRRSVSVETNATIIVRRSNGCELRLESRGTHSGHRFVPAFAELLDHLLVERRNIIGLAACDHEGFFIHPTRSSVTHIGLNHPPPNYLSSPNEIRANQHLR